MDEMLREVTGSWKERWAKAAQTRDALVAERLERYLENRTKRTGQQWTVEERYDTRDSDRKRKPYETWWHRAIITDGAELVRIYYHWVQECWMVA